MCGIFKYMNMKPTKPKAEPIAYVSRAGRDFIARAEGVRHEMYHDSAGLPTIGVGHLLTKSELSSGKIVVGREAVRWRNGLSDEQVDTLLSQDLTRFENAVHEFVQVPLNQFQFDALVSFAFNVGTGAFKRSTLLRVLNRSEYDAVPAQLMRWVFAGGKKVKGLENRRRREANLWLEGVYQ